jgi:hypothetical protein
MYNLTVEFTGVPEAEERNRIAGRSPEVKFSDIAPQTPFCHPHGEQPVPTPMLITGVGLVCQVCYALYYNADNYQSHGHYYFRDLHNTWEKEHEKSKRQLGSGGHYLDG